MPIVDIKSQHDKLARARATQVSAFALAEAENYSSAEAEEQWQRADVEIRDATIAIDASIKEASIKEAALKAKSTWDERGVEMTRPTRSAGAPASRDDGEEWREGWHRYITTGESSGLEERAYTTTTTGAPVPTKWWDQVVEKRDNFTFLLRLANVIQVEQGVNTFKIPNEATLPSPSAVAENPGSDLAASDGSYNALLTVTPRDVLVNTDLSVQGMLRSMPMMDQYLQRALARANAQKLEQFGIAGTGASNQPTGLINWMVSGQIVAMAAASFAASGGADALLDVFHKCAEQYRLAPRFAWVASPTIASAIRKLKDSTGRYYWTVGEFSPDLRMYRPTVLLERPAYESQYMPYDTPAGGAKCTLVGGDFEQFFLHIFPSTGLLVDPYSKRRQLVVNYSLHSVMDCTMVNTDAFCGLRFSS